MKSFIYTFAISFALMSFAYGQTPFLPCADGSPPPVLIDNNCTDQLCNYTTGSDSFVTFQFEAPSKIKSLNLRITYVTSVNLSRIETIVTPQDECDNIIDAECPLKKGQIATITQPILVPTFGFTYLALVEERLVDQNNSTVSCFNLPVFVQESGTL